MLTSISNVDYSVVHHAVLLQDKNRLTLFKEAINKTVRSDSTVVDIGSGTGILSFYASQKTKKKVYAIEYYDFGLNIANKIIKSGHVENIHLIKKSSYETQLSESPNVLITETIGQIGPEENIVEICYDFCKRHPDIQHLIPYKLSIYAVIIDSNLANSYLQNLLMGYLRASFQGFDYALAEEDIQHALANLIFQVNLDDARALCDPILLAEYHLGRTQDSSFNHTIPLQLNFRKKLVHLYFEAHLGNDLILSSDYKQKNHWKHSFFPILDGKSSVNIYFQQGSNFIKVSW